MPHTLSGTEGLDSILPSMLQTDEIAVTGFVRDAETGEPVEEIIVGIDGTDRRTMTAKDGGYVLRFIERLQARPGRPMVRACFGFSYLVEVREVDLASPWSDIQIVRDGVREPREGYAVRLDFVVRRRPPVY